MALRLRNLDRYRGLGLEAKIRYAYRLIDRGLAEAKTPVVLWSGGKDSTVLLHMVLERRPDVLVEYNDTGVEYPETREFVREVEQAWGLNLRVAKAPPGTFWWCVEKYGYPLLGKRHANAKGVRGFEGVRLADNCCYWCKEKPGRLLQRRLGADLLFLGVSASESMRRRLGWAERGDYYQRKDTGVWKVHPLSIWDDVDVWAYHGKFDIPYCALYDMGHRRNGCWPCGMDIKFPDNHYKALRQSHPKLWRHLMVDRGVGEMLVKIKLALNAGQYDLFAGTMGVEQLIEARPCFFDRL